MAIVANVATTSAMRNVPDQRPSRVAGRDARGGSRPGDVECRVVPSHASGGGRLIARRDLVEHFRVIGQGQKSVGQTLRHIDRGSILGVELEALPLQIGWRIETEIDHNVEYPPPKAPYQLRLLVRGSLVVETPQGPCQVVVGDAALSYTGVQAATPELLCVESPGEEASVVLDQVRIDEVAARQFGLPEDHGTTSTSGTGITNRPPQFRM